MSSSKNKDIIITIIIIIIIIILSEKWLGRISNVQPRESKSGHFANVASVAVTISVIVFKLNFDTRKLIEYQIWTVTAWSDCAYAVWSGQSQSAFGVTWRSTIFPYSVKTWSDCWQI